MGYRVIEPITNPADIKPLGVSLRDINTTNYITNDQAYENLKTLLLTRKGERYRQPTFGTYLLNILFEPNVSLIKQQISTLITQPVSQWLPYINIDDINIVTHEDNPSINYNIEVTITFSVAQYDPRTITLTATEEGKLEVS